ncbi:MAG: OmpA family protein [Myxococcales bacterium]
MRSLLTVAVAVFLSAPTVAAAADDALNCKDHSLFSRMPGYFIYRCKEKQFDAMKLKVGDAKKTREESVEGKWSQIIYNFDKSKGAAPSGLQVVRNYQNAVKAVGGTVLWESNRETSLKVTSKGVEYWTLVSEYGTAVTITIIERQAMKQDVVANAELWASDLKATGHASVYGIYFDTGSSTLKPESEPALKEIAKLLGAEATLKLWVVGHTDSVGGLESNVKLSQARAEAVRTALTTQHGIAAERLSAQGCGPLAPVATNSSDEGKAKNRRVELVAQ